LLNPAEIKAVGSAFGKIADNLAHSADK